MICKLICVIIRECFETVTQYSAFGFREVPMYPVAIPFLVKAISLPFICLADGEDNRMIFNVHGGQLQKIDRLFFDAVHHKKETND